MTDTRDRILDATADLLRVNGYAATGIKRVATEAHAPFGSVYHFFPGGKEQLAAESIERAGGYYHDVVVAVFDGETDVVSGTRAVFGGAAEVLEASDYADACPIATVALEVASTSEPLRQSTDRVFESWIASLVSRFVEAGIAAQPARRLAISWISLLEGGFLLSRAAKNTEAMRANGEAAAAVVEIALAATSERSRPPTATVATNRDVRPRRPTARPAARRATTR